MADPVRNGSNVQGALGVDSSGAGTAANYFDNMESLATAAHAQASQQPGGGGAPASYSLQQPPQHPANVNAAAQGMVDPIFFLNDPQSQQQAHQSQQYYPPPNYAQQPEGMYPTAEHLRTSLQLGAGDFQQLMGSLQYSGRAPNDQLLALQQQRHMMFQMAQQQQQLQQHQTSQQQQGQLQHHMQLNSRVHAQPAAYSAPPPASQPVSAVTAAPTESSGVSTPQTEERVESQKSTVRTVPDRTLTKNRGDWRPKTAIPQDLTAEEYASQCIQAAIASRLSPYHLHKSEYELLREHINHVQVTTYLHIRNGILRLWQRNPLVSVTREEAAGCAKDYRFFDVAEVAYDWLVRNGYINFGCIEVPNAIISPVSPAKRRKTVVVIGAGMAGLGCARQLEGLISQFGDRWQDEPAPQVIVLEARRRIGGRVYSHPLHNQAGATLPPGKRATADLGAQVITGFENGNPLGILIRGQLALEYHSLKDNSVLYDTDGALVDKERDNLIEKLFNDMLDRVSIFKQRPKLPKTLEGDRELIDNGKDPTGEGGKMIAEVEEGEAGVPPIETDKVSTNTHGPSPFTAGLDKLTGKPATATGSSASIPAAEQARKLGWQLKPGFTGQETIALEPNGTDPKFPTLGKTMDHTISKYQDFLEFTPLDFRLINWHYANLEYANASNVDSLSLGHWDQDDGQEPSGPHTMLLGGYQQVPRGLWLAPKPLDIKTRHVVKKIIYSTDESASAISRIECENGTVIEADKIVVTLPLGVLKAGSVEFDPPLPEWKTGAIEKMGYGLLNKVALVFEEAFWDVDNDMVGLLREPTGDPLVQGNYESNRGRFYMFWNAMKACGKPLLVALMAGDAAVQMEQQTDDMIVDEAVAVLQSMYPTKVVSRPVETIITRWRKDPFSRGSYSFVGPEATAEDYDLMAKPVGKSLYFAGEASCKSHPATVHGAYISGLRAAAEVADSLLGPIQVPSPLIPPKPRMEASYSSSGARKRKAEESAIERARELKAARLEAYEKAMNDALVKELGERPSKPGRSGANPFLLYQKDHWFRCKDKCDEARRKATGNPEAKASRNEVRAALGQMWRDAPEDEKRPYLAETEKNKSSNAQGISEFKKRVKDWDTEANKFKKEWKEKNPSVASEEEVMAVRQAELEKQEIKRSRKLHGYVDDSADEDY
ncbi:flavin-containing amine oxidoreductase-domain containing protein [Sphaerosporella brunnea]|uniref:Flavin-containing amine oxidoreductase-domain containing protein n=1 Tax=Sphaerosporella brunnea TaxID=1250544 RepID=A0A5J5EG79_9PEZI|nr:flavin-containing amine oxidoreductase-domain containing protein [Sphaerosporella brunnea]